MFKQLKSLVLCAVFCVAMAGCNSGCSSLNSNVYHVEKTATDLVTAGVHDFNQYYRSATNGASADKIKELNNARDQIYSATKDFGLSVALVDGLRLEYKTNQAALPDLQAALAALGDQSVNINNLVQHFRTK